MRVSATRFTTVNPATEDTLAEYVGQSADDLDRLLDSARTAQHAWRKVSFERRAALLCAAAAEFRRTTAESARLISLEMGKPIREAEAEVEKCAWGCEFYAENAEQMLAPETIPSAAASSFTTYAPIGVVLGIMPWNFPLWQVMRFAAPALMAGNTVVLKHAPNVTGCALALHDIFAAAGLPDGVFQIVLIAPDDVPEIVPRLIADPRIAAVTFTGSDRAGAAVGAAAGAAVKRSILELGGSDPFVVLADADPAAVAAAAVSARFLNSGQSCVSPKRLIVDHGIVDAFTDALVATAAEYVVGDPLDRETQVGPIARFDLLRALARQVEETVAEGATLLLGGRRKDGRGFFYTPTVLAEVTPRMTAAREELFGPVATVLVAEGEKEAVALANDTPYGLGASIWTADPERALQFGAEIESGTVFVNGAVASDPRLPFGGTKRSGFGRELGAAGIREFTNLRTFWLAPAASAATGAG